MSPATAKAKTKTTKPAKPQASASLTQVVQSRQTYIIMSPRKIRRILNEVRGKDVTEAFNMLRLMPYTAATVVLKNLIAAASNARVKFGVTDPSQLVVSAAFADEGPAYKRFKPRAQGRIYRREKPTSHITIQVSVKQA
ncbi:MAG: 50S ribosomal protein L22 [Candidatus Melainabacteria bacterium]